MENYWSSSGVDLKIFIEWLENHYHDFEGVSYFSCEVQI